MEKNNYTEKELLSDCMSGVKKAQYVFYKKYSPKMFGICLRYAKNQTDAEDILQEGFIKVFRYLKDYRGDGSFEGWMRRIMVTTSLNFYKKKSLFNKEVDPEMIKLSGLTNADAVSRLSHEELLALIRELPQGYRTVFNLNTIEGYSHKEIGEMLHISINTSKSQLSRAKNSLRNKVAKLFQINTTEINMAACF